MPLGLDEWFQGRREIRCSIRTACFHQEPVAPNTLEEVEGAILTCLAVHTTGLLAERIAAYGVLPLEARKEVQAVPTHQEGLARQTGAPPAHYWLQCTGQVKRLDERTCRDVADARLPHGHAADAPAGHSHAAGHAAGGAAAGTLQRWRLR